MKEQKELKKSFKAYATARKEAKNCKDACLKNGRSDRFCFECASSILDPLIESYKP